MSYFCTVPEALKEIKQGKILILLDGKHRENEGDFFVAGKYATQQKINFMIRQGRGLLCAPISEKIAHKFSLPLMVDKAQNEEYMKCNFTISIDARENITTGISARDRAYTIKLLSKPKAQSKDFVRPGHIFPLVGDEGGLLAREGHTEAALELLALANLPSVGALCEILNKKGASASKNELLDIAREHHLKILRTTLLKQFIIEKNKKISHIADSKFPTAHGNFTLSLFHTEPEGYEHVALWMGKFTKNKTILTRVHSKCFTGDTLYSLRCDCREQLEKSLKMISKNKEGILIYCNQEGRGIGLSNKIRAYHLQDNGYDTVDANVSLGFLPDERDYQAAAEILKYFNISSIKLLTNNPNKVQGLKKYGVKNIIRIPLPVHINSNNQKYLETKKRKMGHHIVNVQHPNQ